MLVPGLNGHVYYNGGHVPNVSWMGKKVSQLPVIESENLCDNMYRLSLADYDDSIGELTFGRSNTYIPK